MKKLWNEIPYEIRGAIKSLADIDFVVWQLRRMAEE